MTPLQAREWVNDRWIANVPAAIGARWWLNNDPVPEAPATDAESWCRVLFVNVVSTQETFGETRRFMREGRITVQLFTPLDFGLATSDTISQAVREIFEAIDDASGTADIRVFEATIQEIGPDGRHFQTNITFPVHYFERR